MRCVATLRYVCNIITTTVYQLIILVFHVHKKFADSFMSAPLVIGLENGHFLLQRITVANDALC